MKEIQAKIARERQIAKELAELRKLAQQQDNNLIDDLQVLDTLHTNWESSPVEFTKQEKVYGKHAKPVEVEFDEEEDTSSLVIEGTHAKKKLSKGQIKQIVLGVLAFIIISFAGYTYLSGGPGPLIPKTEMSQTDKEQQLISDFNSQFAEVNAQSEETGASYTAKEIKDASLVFDIELNGAKNNITLPLTDEQKTQINTNLNNIASSYHLETSVNSLAKKYEVNVSSITIRFVVDGECIIEKELSGTPT